MICLELKLAACSHNFTKAKEKEKPKGKSCRGQKKRKKPYQIPSPHNFNLVSQKQSTFFTGPKFKPGELQDETPSKSS